MVDLTHILTKRGPLARVWMAAHMERKLSKTQTLQTDITDSVEAIIGENGEVMALRISGQLLLGVVRIYNRKARYLLDDCNEAMLKLKMAFRAGPVDMTNAQMTVDRNAITLSGDNVDLNLLLPDINWEFDFDDERVPPARKGGQGHTARQADITLTSDDMQMFSDGFDFDLGSVNGIGSHDFASSGIDLGLDLDEQDGFGDESVEQGRREANASRISRDSIASRFRRDSSEVDHDLAAMSGASRDPSEQPFDDVMNFDLGADADIDLGIGFDDMPFMEVDGEKTPEQTRSPTSPLSTPPRTPPPEMPLDGEATIGPVAEEEDGTTTPKAKKPRKEKKQIVDAVIELANGPGARVGRGRNAQVGGQKVPPEILKEPTYIPSSPTVARLLQIRDDPLAHFMPTITPKNGGPSMVCAAPVGLHLAPELQALFMRPARGIGQNKRRGATGDKTAAKDTRAGSAGAELDEPEPVEEGRRDASVAPSVRSGALGRRSLGPIDSMGAGFDESLGGDSFRFEIPDGGELPPADIELPPVDDLPARGPSVAASDRARSRSRFSTPGAAFEDEGMTGADATCPIAAFDIRQTQSQPSQAPSDIPDVREDGKGYSKNTIKAINLIRKELQQTDDDDGEAEKVMNFNDMAHKASRRAASGFFFELLVLSTRDCVKVSQAGPFEGIEIRAKNKLWDDAQSISSQRQSSVARSISSSMGL